MFASQLTAYLGVLGLIATVVVATQYSNSTDGLTFVVIVLTAYLVLTEPKRRLEQRELFWRYLADAVYETCHKLQHIAKAYTAESSLETWPDFHLRAALRLIDPPFNDYMLRAEPHLWPHLDHMIRNDLYMQRYPFTPEGAQAGRDVLGYFARGVSWRDAVSRSHYPRACRTRRGRAQVPPERPRAACLLVRGRDRPACALACLPRTDRPAPETGVQRLRNPGVNRCVSRPSRPTPGPGARTSP